MSDTRDAECRRNCWLIAAGGGILTLLMLWLVGTFGFFTSLIIGLILFAALGFFLVWAFCTGMEAGADSAATTSASAASGTSAPSAAARPVPAAPANAPEPAAAPEPEVARETATAPVRVADQPTTTDSAGGLGAALAKSKTTGGNGAPEMLSAPRSGKADDLKRIKGIGPKLEKLLNEIGVWHFDQIASWKAKDIAFVDEKLEGFKGRVTRDGWVKQAKQLAQGGVYGGD
ncbi:50S ribosomal protein L21 [Defluviimonas aquaemixtae]|uniref:50S ribosomal protein L21 n=1 Tax=Albidovulum aquaemixtae TaxID=1542388 RepID=A0A2R8B479_9RHOB|nr:hypothetical protein [Defluviimonas aquaemixtae]SPH17330.1 50S ribosomal protein L21 [Defluviimonas aquaemixtae]